MEPEVISDWLDGAGSVSTIVKLARIRSGVDEDEQMRLQRRAIIHPDAGRGGFVAAAVLGTIHASFSIYWAVGGTWLVWSLGTSLIETFQQQRWVLVPIGVGKLIAAVGPLVLACLGWPARRLTRTISWAGAVVLIVWGGLNTLVAGLVLSGVIQPESGYDRPGMIGHAYLWDPLFLAWGLTLFVGLLGSRHSAPKDTDLAPSSGC